MSSPTSTYAENGEYGEHLILPSLYLPAETPLSYCAFVKCSGKAVNPPFIVELFFLKSPVVLVFVVFELLFLAISISSAPKHSSVLVEHKSTNSGNDFAKCLLTTSLTLIAFKFSSFAFNTFPRSSEINMTFASAAFPALPFPPSFACRCACSTNTIRQPFGKT